jgi:tetratricopeptide (TPR) repeat protein
MGGVAAGAEKAQKEPGDFTRVACDKQHVLVAFSPRHHGFIANALANLFPPPVRSIPVAVTKSETAQVCQELEQLAARIDRAADASENSQEAVRSLAESLEVVAAHMRKQRRALSVNSMGAYGLFTLLLGSAFFVLYRDHADRLVEQRDRAERARGEAEARAAAAEMYLATRVHAAEAANAFWQLLQGQRYFDAIASYPELAARELTPTEQAVLGDAVLRARNQIAGGHLTSGRKALERGQPGAAEVELRTAALYAVGSQAGETQFALGLALLRQGRPLEAQMHFGQALAAGAEQIPWCAAARYWYADALERSGEEGRARAEYERFARSAPRHAFAWKAHYRSQLLARRADD